MWPVGSPVDWLLCWSEIIIIIDLEEAALFFATVGTRRPSCDVIKGVGSTLGGEKAGEIWK